DHHLQLAALAVAQRGRPVPEVDEVDLAGLAAQDDAAGDLDPGPLVVGGVGGEAEDVGDGRVPVEALAPGVDAERLEGAEFLGAAGLEGVGFAGHGYRTFSRGWKRSG